MADKGQGWHGDSKGHAQAAKGQSTNKSSSDKSQGWHGDSKGHAKAAKGQTKDEGGLGSKILGNE